METTKTSMPDSESVRKIKDAISRAREDEIEIRSRRLGIWRMEGYGPQSKWATDEERRVCPLGALLLGETVSPDAYEQAAEMLGVDILWIDGFIAYFDKRVPIGSYDGYIAAKEIRRWLAEEAGTAKLALKAGTP